MADEGASGGPVAVLRQVPATLGAVASYPGAVALVFGLALVFVSLVERAGPYEFESAEELWITRGVGIAFVVAGAAWTRRADRRRALEAVPPELRNDLPAVAFDPEFLLKVFVTGMPPAFVKEYTEQASGPNFLESDALVALQKHASAVPLKDSGCRRAVIKEDHRTGDVNAADNGQSRQLEVTDTLRGDEPHVILTTKRCIEHRGKTYIVGWAVPVGLRTVPTSSTMWVKEDFNEPLFRVTQAPLGTGLSIDVGRGVRELHPAADPGVTT